MNKVGERLPGGCRTAASLGEVMRFFLPEHVQKNFRLGAVIVSLAMCFGEAAHAGEGNSGLYLTLEGILGSNNSERTGLNYSYTEEIGESWQGFGAVIDYLNGGRVEAGWLLEDQSGTPFQLAISYTRLSAQRSRSMTVAGWTYGEPPEIPGDKPVVEINICDDGPCLPIGISFDHRYWEVSPEFSMVVGGTDDNFFWLGMKPFYGQIDQESFTTNGKQGLDNTLNAELYGAMLTGQKDFRLSDRNTLSVTTGIGWYVVEADGFSIGRSEGTEVHGSQKSGGARAQLGVSLDHELSSNVSLGAAAKLDYWSNQPYIMTGRSSGGRCEVSPGGPICTPPRVTAFEDNVHFDEMFDYFLGLNVTFRY